MTVPRDFGPLALFIHISLEIHTSPSAQPAMNLKASQTGMLGRSGINSRMTAAKRMPATMQRFSPKRTITRGYKGPHRMTAIKLAAVTAPMEKLE